MSAAAAPVLPESEYPFATEVPKKGAKCSTCRSLSPKDRCTNPYYVGYAGTDVLPKKPGRWCCNAWKAEG